MLADPRRATVVAEALSWVGTPYHSEARVKGHGVDCIFLLVEVYAAAGIISRDIEVPWFPRDYMLHSREEHYLAGLMRYAREIPGPPEPGDIAVFKFGHSFSHGTIVTAWPMLIHAHVDSNIVLPADATKGVLAVLKDGRTPRPVRFFSPF